MTPAWVPTISTCEEGILRVRSLASGSNGNCAVVQSGDAVVLVDAGISARAILAGLAATGIPERAVRAILLTHEHSDHVRGLAVLARRLGAVIVANRETLAHAAPAGAETRPLATGGSLEIAGIRVRSFATSHDAANPVGYVIEAEGARVGVATDTGVPDCALEHLQGVDLAILESNHDVECLLAGPYPRFLKRRILGDCGHLSNAAAAEVALALLARAPAAEIWLAHLSATNNTPQMAFATVSRCLEAAGHSTERLSVAPRGRPGPVWESAGRWQQLPLF